MEILKKEYKTFEWNDTTSSLDKDGFLTTPLALYALNEVLGTKKVYEVTYTNGAEFLVTDYTINGVYLVSYRQPLNDTATSYLTSTEDEAALEQIEAKEKLEKIRVAIEKAKPIIEGKAAKNANDRLVLKLNILAADATIFEGLSESLRDYVLQEALKQE